MCGRYTLACPDEETLIRGLPFDAFSETRIQFRPRYNIAPGQRSPVVYLQSGRPVLADALWGMTRSGGGLAINARSETAERTALFRDAFAGTADASCQPTASYEWRKEGRVSTSLTCFDEPTRGGLFVMAGLCARRPLRRPHPRFTRRARWRKSMTGCRFC